MGKFRIIAEVDEDVFDELCSYSEHRVNIVNYVEIDEEESVKESEQMVKESCESCMYHRVNHWTDPQQHICGRTMEAFAVRPSSIPPCLAYKPKPIYIPKRGA